VIVNDTSPPSADFVSPTPSDISYQSATNVTINISTSDNWNVSTIVTKIFNTTWRDIMSCMRIIGRKELKAQKRWVEWYKTL
jgi:hypothetical protein